MAAPNPFNVPLQEGLDCLQLQGIGGNEFSEVAHLTGNSINDVPTWRKSFIFGTWSQGAYKDLTGILNTTHIIKTYLRGFDDSFQSPIAHGIENGLGTDKRIAQSFGDLFNSVLTIEWTETNPFI